MTARTAVTASTAERPQSWGEELVNALSHGLGFLLAVAALPILVVFSGRHGVSSSLTGVVVFSVTMMLLYGASALYHALPAGRAKVWFQRLDHAAIFLFIAGSYTPFVLGPLHGPWGWSLFGVVWGAAALGITAKVLDRLKHPFWSTGLYVAMGWVALVAVVPMVERVPFAGLALLVAGGVAYTLGAVFFLLDNRVRYAHFVWHLFVLAGSTCHFFAALFHAA
jgi:hemolysin III